MRRLAPGLLRENRDFRSVWIGQTISLFGDQITLLVVPLVAVLELHAGPQDMGFLVAAAWLPYLLFALQAGSFVDRRGRRRKTMLWMDLGRAALILSIPPAYFLHVLTLGQLFAVAFLNGSLSVFFDVADASFFAVLVSRDAYLEGQALLNGSRAFSFIAGPSVAGWLVQLFSGPIALVVDALSFIASAVSLARVSPQEPAGLGSGGGGIRPGIRFILKSPAMQASLGATATINLFNLAFNALFILYVVRGLHVRPGTLGLVLGAAASGGLIGSFVAGGISRRIGVGPACILGCALFTAPALLVPSAGGPYALVLTMVFLAEFGGALGVMILDISLGAIQAALVPVELRSRVNGAYSQLNYGVRPIGALLGGFLASAVGLRSTLWVVAALATLGTFWLIPSPIRKMRELPSPDVMRPV